MEAVAKLNNYPTSPRKMRLLADLIRGMEVEKALSILQFNPKHPATPLYKLLKSAINNWEQKNSNEKVEDAGLVVKTIMVDGGRVLRRMRPAPQGRGYRIRKRSNHVTIVVDSRQIAEKIKHAIDVAAKAEPVAEEVKAEEAEVKVKAEKPAKKAAPKAKKSSAKAEAKKEESKKKKSTK
ncbi:MAG: 50S ribosomal protein L22 [Chitinophagaceae bacterium]|nr:50S ribosomal protein L22 [Chitinophagaceae bacterium]